MLAAANVELVLDEGCLRMGSGDGHLIIWPPGFSLATEDDGVQILNETGLIVARVGEKVRMSGGQVRSSAVPEATCFATCPPVVRDLIGL